MNCDDHEADPQSDFRRGRCLGLFRPEAGNVVAELDGESFVDEAAFNDRPVDAGGAFGAESQLPAA